MAGRPLSPAQIRKILEMYDRGVSNREIARLLDPPVYKGTVNRYISFIRTNGLDTGALSALSDVDLDRVFHKGNPAYTEPRMEAFIRDLPEIEADSKRDGITALGMWLRYRARNRDAYYQFTQFRFHLMQVGLMPAASTSASEECEDRGACAVVTTRTLTHPEVDADTGEETYVRIAALYMLSSEYMRLCPIRSLDISHMVDVANMFLEQVRGLPETLVTDDLAKVCTRTKDMRSSVESVLNRLHSYYGCGDSIQKKDLALARKRIDRVFDHLNHALATMRPLTLSEVDSAVALFEERYNRTRVRGRGHSREEDFLRKERPLLRPIPEAFYDAGDVGDHTAHMDGTIMVGKERETGYYSVPVDFIGRKVKCIHGTKRILILDERGLIAAHPRVDDYKYSLNEEHVRQWEESAYNNMGALECRAFNISPRIAAWVSEFFRRAPEQGLRLQECVRKYENIERMACQEGALMSGFCEICRQQNIYGYKEFIRGFYAYRDRYYKDKALRGNQLN